MEIKIDLHFQSKLYSRLLLYVSTVSRSRLPVRSLQNGNKGKLQRNRRPIRSSRKKRIKSSTRVRVSWKKNLLRANVNWSTNKPRFGTKRPLWLLFNAEQANTEAGRKRVCLLNEKRKYIAFQAIRNRACRQYAGRSAYRINRRVSGNECAMHHGITQR